MPPTLTRPPVAVIVDQHVSDLATLWNTRRDHTRAPHVALHHLKRLDDRIAAHVDGCVVAGSDGMRRLLGQLADPQPAVVFAAAVVALETGDIKSFNHCVTVAESLPLCAAGAVSALGWVPRDRLTGVGRELLESTSRFRARLGLAACRVHRVDSGASLTAAVTSSDLATRAEAFRTVGTIGGQEHLRDVGVIHDEEPDTRFWSAWAAALLGDHRALDTLTRVAAEGGSHRARAFRLSLQAMPVTAAHTMLQELRHDPERLRPLLEGSGIAGNPAYVPWLISQMSDEKVSRVAGEAFSTITGLNLALADLERKPPEDFESGPTDDPDDPNVDLDSDDGLPWPDSKKIEAWWAANGSRFQPGTRYFMGAPVTREHCIDVLKNGFQRQRILAAHYLCLLEPGTPLFSTSAPAWRQQRLLAKLA